MATTTTNFGWDIPQSTDLVKDGATAIAALGQDIDTALVDLKGGTTGQVLAKASGSDLDFSWVAQDDSNAIQNTQLTAKGALISAFSAGTPATLTVGTNGQVLTADSTAATGLAWAAATSGGYTQIASTSIAGSGTSIGSIAGTYNKLVLVVQDWFPSTNGENLRLRFNSDSTASIYGQAGVTNGAAYANAQNFIWASYQGAVNSDNNNFFVMQIENYANTNSHKVATYANYYLSGSTQMIDTGAFRYKSTTAITSVDLASTSGNIGQGTAILWGVK